jgi:hypothetical protein
MAENEWWIREYGTPCRECGFDWATRAEDAIVRVEGLPARLDELLSAADATGTEVPARCSWSVTGYVFHVADNLRIFAERLEGVRAGGPTALVGYDENELAAARHYEELALPAGLWSLRQSVPMWAAVCRTTLVADQVFVHSDYGALTASEIVRAPAHDALHHEWDVQRAVAGAFS